MQNGTENKTTDQNTEKDLQNILTSVAKSEKYENYKISLDNNRTKGEGFLSEFFTGEVLNEDNGQKIEVAIKRAPSVGFSASFGNKEIYENEVYFYSVVFPALDKFQKKYRVRHAFQHIPKYLTGCVESTNPFLAMENLKAKGYVLFDKKKFLDSQHLEYIFKTYGRWHALSFSFKQKNEEAFEDLVKSFSDIMKKFTDSGEAVTMMKKSYLAALNAFDPVTEADILKKLKTVENVSETLKDVQMYKGAHKCLVHGDCWSNNMLFKYKESGELKDIKLLDFQLTRSSTPIHDLSYFFYSGASKDEMDKLDYYLNLYYKSFSGFMRELGENPEKIFPFEVLKKEWKQYGVWGVLLGCQVWLLKLMDQNEINSVIDQKDLTNENYWDVWDKKWSKILVGQEFRERTKNICLHAVEYGIIGC